MEASFLNFIRNPKTKSPFEVYIFEQEDENILFGLLVSVDQSIAYPIDHGVPVLVPNSFSEDFLSRFNNELNEINKRYNKRLSFTGSKNTWSFSAEWESHFKESMTKTWGWTVEERFEQFLMETQTLKEDLTKQLVLDAGCGNGMLTERISASAKLTFGIDLSDSVFLAEKNRTSKKVCFIKGDLQSLPFEGGVFDIIVSNGVIHHTPSTETTFYSLANAVNTDGKLYIWLYSEKGTFAWRAKRKFFDVARAIVSRTNQKVQNAAVNLFTAALKLIHNPKDVNALRINMYDSLTPRWRHYHTPEEIAHWYHKAGFGPVSLTHFDNKYGFGACGKKDGMQKTPGENFGSPTH